MSSGVSRNERFQIKTAVGNSAGISRWAITSHCLYTLLWAVFLFGRSVFHVGFYSNVFSLKVQISQFQLNFFTVFHIPFHFFPFRLDFVDKHRFSDFDLKIKKKIDSFPLFFYRQSKFWHNVFPPEISGQFFIPRLFSRFRFILLVSFPLKNQKFSVWFLDVKKSISIWFWCRFCYQFRFFISAQFAFSDNCVEFWNFSRIFLKWLTTCLYKVSCVVKQ